MSNIKVADRLIGDNNPTYFIADIAANHDGDLSRALELIHLAKQAGADCAKFQHFGGYFEILHSNLRFPIITHFK